MSNEPGPTVRYVIQDAIGAGGAGQVFRAWDQHLQRHVAIKRLRADVEMDANIRREAGILAALHHPNIVTIYDFATDEIGQFAVMEYVEGKTLEEIVSRQPLSLGAFAELANQVCRGLSAAHSRGLVHLDLKAGNLMLQPHEDRSFTSKILDFGLAHLYHETKASDSDDGSILGSPYTVAPEQLLREPVDARTDVYSLGCVFYQALSGREPFACGGISEVLQRHLHGKPTPLHLVAPTVPATLSHVIARMTARQPADRPQSAEEARRLIQGAMRAPATTNRSPGGASAQGPGAVVTPRPATKGSGGLTFLFLASLVAAAGGFIYWRGTHPSEPTPEPSPAPAATPAYPVVDPRDPQTVAKYNGQNVTMEGVVASCNESELFHAHLLRFSDTQDAAAVLSIDTHLLSEGRARSFVGKRVRATGQISNSANRTRLLITSEANLKVVR